MIALGNRASLRRAGIGDEAGAAANDDARSPALSGRGAACGPADLDPRFSARAIPGPEGRRLCGIAIASLCLALALAPAGAASALHAIATVYLLAAVGMRLVLAIAALAQRQARRTPPPIADADLPIVTVLLPVRDEARGLPILAEAMARLDYPRDRLDMKLIVDADDSATIAEARRLRLERVFDLLIVPEGLPRTKPRACNVGLEAARGQLLVIYDAEDAPETDQLRKAAAAFAAGAPDLACVQARLNFYNAEDNLLTRLFALEYGLWFDVLLPGLQRLGCPIPLGGTSNIFRTRILRQLGGWDPHNVTEDADLGFRLARLGYRTEILDSTTFEEANSRIGNWIRQRSRWMKGHLQTFLVHMRDPRQLIGACGWRGYLTLQLFIGGNPFAALINPLLWAAFFASALVAADPSGHTPGPHVIALVAGNLLVAALAAAAALRRGRWRLAPYAALAPVYWQLASIAAWKGLIELFVRPHHWAKTEHVLGASGARRRAAALDARAGAIAPSAGAS